MKGIDISNWQGNVDFNKVKADGIQFCIFREGYRRAIDGQFKNYVAGAKAAGIPILGVYHFIYIDGATPKQNAEACIANMKAAGLDPTNTWIFSDLEYDTWTKAGVTVQKHCVLSTRKSFLTSVKPPAARSLAFTRIWTTTEIITTGISFLNIVKICGWQIILVDLMLNVQFSRLVVLAR